jgi:hypothetical protein
MAKTIRLNVSLSIGIANATSSTPASPSRNGTP